jgi:recombination protein RecA
LIERDHGKRTVVTFSDEPEEVEVVSSGILPLDKALGVGGVPKGLIEVYGDAGNGKSSVALSMAASIQKKGGKILFIDAEYALNKKYAQDLGVVFDDSFLIVQPRCTEQALDIIEKFLENNVIDMIIIDSLAALSPKVEIEGSSGDVCMGLQARLISQFLRRMMQHIKRTRLVVINQVRAKLNTFGFGGELTETTGGKAMKFYSFIRLEVKKIGFLKKAEQKIGHRVRINIVKNRFAVPFQECDFDLIYGIGVSNEGFILDEAIKNKLIDKQGAWLIYKDIKIQGRDKFIQYLKENESIYNELKESL